MLQPLLRGELINPLVFWTHILFMFPILNMFGYLWDVPALFVHISEMDLVITRRLML